MDIINNINDDNTTQVKDYNILETLEKDIEN